MSTHCVCTGLQTVSFLTSALNKVQHSSNVFSTLKGSICFSPSFYQLSGFTFAAEWQKSPHRSWICFRSAVLSLPRALLSHICPINSSWSAAQAFCERLWQRVCGRPVTFSRPVTVFFVPWLACNQQSPVIGWNQNQPGWIGRLRTSTKLLSLKTFWVLRWFASMSQLVNPPAEESTIKLMMMRKDQGKLRLGRVRAWWPVWCGPNSHLDHLMCAYLTDIGPVLAIPETQISRSSPALTFYQFW